MNMVIKVIFILIVNIMVIVSINNKILLIIWLKFCWSVLDILLILFVILFNMFL